MICLLAAALLAANAARLPAQTQDVRLPETGWLKPYGGESRSDVENDTMYGKVLCGYQGWFTAPNDGSGLGWHHWAGRNGFEPGSCSIDLWPDVAEMGPDERVATTFRHADGSTAHVYSSHNVESVLRHFRWMREYGLDGVFVQRFGVELRARPNRNHFTKVLSSCREGANRYGRVYAVMYDLSGLGPGETSVVRADWSDLESKMRVTDDPAYLRHRGKPVVAVWGLGFSDGRRYSLSEGLALVRHLQSRGCTVMVGMPTFWRTRERDCLDDPLVEEIAKAADIVSPWTVGRFRTPDEARAHVENTVRDDLKWCAANGVDYMPVAFPGFSWSNLKPGAQLDQIPRLKGRFLDAQYQALLDAGARMVYQAMFDEVDEGTAIFKCTNDPPVGASRFLDLEKVEPDFYLKRVGSWTSRLRKASPEVPVRGRARRGQ